MLYKIEYSLRAIQDIDGFYDYIIFNYQDYFVAVYDGWFGMSDNSSYMEDPLIATLGFFEDGSADLVPSNDDYGPLEGFAYVFYDENGTEYNYNKAVWFGGSTIQKGLQADQKIGVSSAMKREKAQKFFKANPDNKRNKATKESVNEAFAKHIASRPNASR